MKRMVGAAGFELATLCSQSRCATRLRYAPTKPQIVAWKISASEKCRQSATKKRLGAARIDQADSFCAICQPSSAIGLAPAAASRAWALEAVPSSTRLAMPCRIAQMRNRL